MALLPEVVVTLSAIILISSSILLWEGLNWAMTKITMIFFVVGFILEFRRGSRQLSRPVQDELGALCGEPSTKVWHDRFCSVPFGNWIFRRDSSPFFRRLTITACREVQLVMSDIVSSLRRCYKPSPP